MNFQTKQPQAGEEANMTQTTTMGIHRRRLAVILASLFALLATLSFAQQSSAAAPQWQLSVKRFPVSFAAGTSGDIVGGPAVRVTATNSPLSSPTAKQIEEATTSGPYTITLTLPPELTLNSEVRGRTAKAAPSFKKALGLAVDQSTGALLVIDGEANTITRWNSDGTPANFSALGTNVINGAGGADATPEGKLEFGSAEKMQIAVDNSGGPNDGNIYVPQATAGPAAEGLVDIFDRDGNFLGQLTKFSQGPAAEGAEEDFTEPCGIAVDPSGDLYVGDLSGAIHKFEPAGNPPVNADSVANFPFAGSCALAAGAGPTDGFLFAAHLGGSVAKLDTTTGAEQYEVDAVGPTTTLSVDPSNGHLFTVRGEEIAEFDASDSVGAAELAPPISLDSAGQGVAVSGSTGHVYATRFGQPTVEEFTPISGHRFFLETFAGTNKLTCDVTGQIIACTGSQPLVPGQKAELLASVDVAADAAGTDVALDATVEGGGAGTLAAAAEVAIGVPVWRLSGVAIPTLFTTSGGQPRYQISAINVGSAATTGPITLTDVLPEGIEAISATLTSQDAAAPAGTCSIATPLITCTSAGPIHPGRHLFMEIMVAVGPGAAPASVNHAEVSGGGAPDAAFDLPSGVSDLPLAFDFLSGSSGFAAPIFDFDGTPATQAGSHPDNLIVELGFPGEQPAGALLVGVEGGLRDGIVDLPRGLVLNPEATPVRCTEAELTSQGFPGCPRASVIGNAIITTTVGDSLGPRVSPLYNMVPPPGIASSFSFDAVGVGIFPHVIGSVRSDGDYGLSGASNDVLALGKHPVLSARLEFWGDPTSPQHDSVRGASCIFQETTAEEFLACPVARHDTPLITTPVECSGAPPLFQARADSWGNPGVFHHADYLSADLAGNPLAGIDGCNQLSFEPTIEATPTTNLADAPSGLDFTLHQPQSTGLESLATAIMRDATVTLPRGFSVNPASADGQQACSAAQAGLTTAPGQTPIRFDKNPDNCPDAAKLGRVSATTPLLDHPLKGALYLAEPFDNPFDSLFAIYIAIDDPATGTVAKLAGQVLPDPATGQLTTVFKENPQLPIEDIELHLFPGARASLRTPPTCATHTTTSTLVPWSSPQTPDASPADSFALTGSGSGGPCPATDPELPHGPTLAAGTLEPLAGAYSPFITKITRPDGSQEISRVELTAPPGLSGKLAGIPYCPEAGLAQALARAKPEQGALELASPSCPAASEVGTVIVGAGAGPTPLHVSGRVYLAGPYKGAPLSLAVITPAIAGPFDLGAVLSRVALYVDPVTAQIRALSDPLPVLIEGIPLDIRSVYVRLDRPDFTVNPTSCDPMALDRHRHLDPRRDRPHEQPLPGRRLPGPRLQAQAQAGAQGRHQARHQPAPDRHPQSTSRRCQHRPRPGQAAECRLPRPVPHRHRLHPGPVRRRHLPTGLRLRQGKRDHAAARLSAHRQRLPALLLQPAA